MAPKDLYYLPQVFIVTKDGSKEEFAGITQFGLDTESGAVYDNLIDFHDVFDQDCRVSCKDESEGVY